MPYCPACRADYAPGTDRCHDCEVALEEGLPGDETAEPEGPPPGPLVTVAAFDTPLKASILASRLEAEGIECFIADAEVVGLNNLLAGAVGGVKVQVRESDAPRASAVARETATRGPEKPLCPRCESNEVQRKGMSILAAVLMVLTFGILALFIPVRWKCDKCSHRWM
jgi:hypothetical protein